MKRYRCCKIVEATKITAAQKNYPETNWEIACDDGQVYEIAGHHKITEADLGYLVRYSDGYTSWSPSKAFEEGYIEITPPFQGSKEARLTLMTYDGQLLEAVDLVDEKLLELNKSTGYQRALLIALLEAAGQAVIDKYKD